MNVQLHIHVCAKNITCDVFRRHCMFLLAFLVVSFQKKRGMLCGVLINAYLCKRIAEPTMKKVLYIHGFASAGSTGSATQMRNHFYPKGVQVVSPDVPVDPIEAIAFLKKLVEEEQPDLIVATSMGALYAEQLKGRKRILVNPSFHMARLLTFRGLGKREFRNKRQDGATEFKVDKAMIQAFQQVEKESFKAIDASEKALVWGLFGKQDNLVNCQSDFQKHYGKGQMILFEGEHFLNDKVLSKVVMPLVESLINV